MQPCAQQQSAYGYCYDVPFFHLGIVFPLLIRQFQINSLRRSKLYARRTNSYKLPTYLQVIIVEKAEIPFISIDLCRNRAWDGLTITVLI